MAIASAGRLPVPIPDDIPVLRWIYQRDGETLQCELSLSHDLSAYELRLSPGNWNPATYLFDDAISAFEQQRQVESGLTGQGWRLERFERDRKAP